MVLLAICLRQQGEIAASQTAGSTVESERKLVTDYCAGCHNDQLRSGGFSWTTLDVGHPEQNAEQAEKIIRKLRAGMMPPAGARRPAASALKGLAAALETR